MKRLWKKIAAALFPKCSRCRVRGCCLGDLCDDCWLASCALSERQRRATQESAEAARLRAAVRPAVEEILQSLRCPYCGSFEHNENTAACPARTADAIRFHQAGLAYSLKKS